MRGRNSRSAQLVTRTVGPGPAALLLLCLVFLGSHIQAAGAAEVVVATYEGVINPVAAEYLHDAMVSAESTRATALIVKLDTPGGLDTSMRLIVKDITASTVPVVVFVAPSGARAFHAREVHAELIGPPHRRFGNLRLFFGSLRLFFSGLRLFFGGLRFVFALAVARVVFSH